jgi:NADH-quinone oxidoreductase subunit K
MNSVPLSWYIGLGMILFVIGATGVIIRRNPVIVFMCIELMLNAVNLTFLAFSRYSPTVVPGMAKEPQTWMTGQVMVIFVMAVAAAEVAIGLGIIMAIFRLRNSVDLDEMDTMRG